MAKTIKLNEFKINPNFKNNKPKTKDQRECIYCFENMNRAKAEGYSQALADVEKEIDRWKSLCYSECSISAADFGRIIHSIRKRIAKLKGELLKSTNEYQISSSHNCPQNRLDVKSKDAKPVDSQSEQVRKYTSESFKKGSPASEGGCGKIIPWKNGCNYCWEENLCESCRLKDKSLNNHKELNDNLTKECSY